MADEVLRIDVVLDEEQKVSGGKGEVSMLLFHGTFESRFGSGVILSGGVDTQVQKKGELRSLSARYILQGTSRDGSVFRIFIENNGVCEADGRLVTQPILYTDAEEMRWLEDVPLVGSVEGNGEGRVLIKIFQD